MQDDGNTIQDRLSMQRYIFNPFSILMVIILIVAVIILLPLLFLGLIGGALTNLGFTWLQAIALIILILAGSLVNIPVTTLREEAPAPPQPPRGQFAPSLYEGMYRVQPPAKVTRIAVNVGGAVIPVLISLYLLYHTVAVEGDLLRLALAGVGVLAVAILTNRVARPIPGVGISTPFFIPPIAALVCGILLGGSGMGSVVIAYVSGTLGTLIGADLLNLNKMGGLGVPVVSIGGAGTFDGIFLAGIIAAFLA
ncbi:putative membrane protein [Methanocalculus alkaliphilus]|uniref:DUF1614 domain-containing protein n=1 Tax=Methanocalculus alkaliphilus TaxID=768730 RepID=UPI00209EFFAB|nr:DUF1614 domain-containing protein [Methanocalculus alkaliphilus]MCP1714250.1 putative membrane protein [Methanocalculus alkaliphilus]